MCLSRKLSQLCNLAAAGQLPILTHTIDRSIVILMNSRRNKINIKNKQKNIVATGARYGCRSVEP